MTEKAIHFLLDLVITKRELSGNKRPNSNSPTSPIPFRPRLPSDAACELAVRVKTEVAVPFAGTVAEVGLNEQATSPDELEHAKFTLPLKPFTGETVTLKFAEPPFPTLALVGLTEAVKSATCSWAVTE
jgi:hypothetical protein